MNIVLSTAVCKVIITFDLVFMKSNLVFDTVYGRDFVGNSHELHLHSVMYFIMYSFELFVAESTIPAFD